MKPLIKVCGMRDAQNILDIAALHPDMMGFIFFPASKRFVGEGFDVPLLHDSIEKVGVFVDEKPEKIICTLKILGFQTAQLHGSETPGDCGLVRKAGFKVMKAFGLYEGFDWDNLVQFKPVTDCFLFDTKTSKHGGSGRKFNWKLLENYKLDHPFLLSGGIGPEDWAALSGFDYPQCIGFDINSGFETAPAVKDVSLVRQFVDKIRKNGKT